MNGLHAALDELVTDVPQYGDLDRAIAQADQERRRRYGLLAGLAAAAAVLIVIAGILAITHDNNAVPPPIAPTPTPTPTPTSTFESPGPQDHPITIAAVDDALLLVTMDQLEQVGSATVWRRDSGTWQKLGTLEHAVPEHMQSDSEGTRLSSGPGPLDVIAIGRGKDATQGIGFSRDGGATWSYLTNPSKCGDCWIEAHGDDLYAWDVHDELDTLLRAPFGATGWEEVPLPSIPDSDNGYVPPFVLEDGTLVVSEVTLDDDDDHCPSPYRVSRDHGDTWSGRRAAPPSTCINGFVGNTLCASDGYLEREFRSTDLVHWDSVQGNPCVSFQLSDQDLPAACSWQDPAYHWVSDPPLGIGDEVFRLFHVDDSDPWKNRVTHVLKVSRDDCRTWQKALP